MSGIYVRMPMLLMMFAAVLTLAACGERDSRCAELPWGGRYCLQPTTAIAPFEAQQKVEVSFNGRHETMIVDIEADTNGLQFVGLTPFGHKLVQVSYDNREAKAATLPDARLDPALLVALLQLALWPADAVRAGLGAPLVLEEGGGQRRILANDKLVLDINYADVLVPHRRLHLALPSAGLELNVVTLPAMGKE